MISLGLGDIPDFPFLQPPDSRGIKDGLDLLTELGALEVGRATRRASPRSAAARAAADRPAASRAW